MRTASSSSNPKNLVNYMNGGSVEKSNQLRAKRTKLKGKTGSMKKLIKYLTT